ncbi:glycosyl hydrolase 115 family protein [Flavihumibacter petaseus]|uniref:Gylcosyl hydrolase 115 C-terminal domain-containing protein n=1 Tax=Flavihumibacter petaseus NBRC 106054 TaxID=1220578 RepID=A0A0E9MYQ5_9BACT|nr:glycosyl hydrolase 115 family protein [Flavihumibacter petaseus]GAO42648.1 hypothetical protein FPE01S_01_16630 [Flavihumibacter petaseus NBRC 106054]
MKRLPKVILTILLTFSIWVPAIAQGNLVASSPAEGHYPLFDKTLPAAIWADSNDHEVVTTATELLNNDLRYVSGREPVLSRSLSSPPPGRFAVIIGSADKSALIAMLIRTGKLRLDSLTGKWEGYLICTVDHPVPGLEKALVITGNDRRGTAYGIFELSKACGVSPWYWWADVPVKRQDQLYLNSRWFKADAPRVRYRGIFLNDEAPALANWTRKTFGGFNHRLYEKVFELILRLRGNYIWPAMWGNAFYADDPENIRAAEKFAMVIGTSHHEPLMRAHDEWRRFGKGAWNYDSNAARLKMFWKAGMERATNEKIVTVGMRGDGDEPMTQGTAIALLERIVADQREIISAATGKQASETPQLWALYKEVQAYYDKGMRVPDDITLLLCDDNWGNIRRLPPAGTASRKGGYGIYYHFDYVGDPRNYKWLNTNNIAKVWEQMHLAWEYQARQIWIVNVGDLKPMEYPIQFFLDYAWDPPAIDADDLRGHAQQWASSIFGREHGKDVGDLLWHYSILSAHPKPELLHAGTYSLLHYSEAERVLQAWRNIRSQARTIALLLPKETSSAYFQLVLHPIEARCNLQEMYHAVALNQLYAATNDQRVNQMADSVRWYYREDSLLTRSYHALNGGKWDHFMDQTHIGYTYWQQPEANSMPQVSINTTGIPVSRPVMTASSLPAPDQYSFLAARFNLQKNGKRVHWKKIDGIGREGAAMTTFPVTISPADDSCWLEYNFTAAPADSLTATLYFSPTLDFPDRGGLRYAVSVDGGPERQLVFNPHPVPQQEWERWVAENIIRNEFPLGKMRKGKHTFRYRPLDPGILLQKVIIHPGTVPPSLMGAPPSPPQ